jgi:Flp pilus assembly protein TadG
VRARTGERGAVLVEFALVLPLVVLFAFGVIEFGRAYSARISLTSAVREGARVAALGGDAVAATKNGAAGLRASDVTVNYTPTPGSSCAGAGTTTSTIAATGTTTTTIATATVTATYDFHYDIPLFRSGTWTLSATGVFRCGG